MAWETISYPDEYDRIYPADYLLGGRIDVDEPMRPLALQELGDAPEEAYREILLPFGKFVLGFLVLYLVGRLIVGRAILRVVRQRNRNNPTIQSALESYLHLLIFVLAVGAGIAAAGFSQVLTRSAVIVAAATLAIGVAGQEVLGALISGLFLVANPNFNVGDWIAWGDRAGVVEAISLRTTRIRTENNEIVTVPNTELTTNTIVSAYGREQYRVSVEVGIEYDDDMDAAMRYLRDAAETHPSILSDPQPVVYFTEFGDDALVLEIQYWIRNPTRKDVKRVRSEFALEVKSLFEDAGITISPASHHELSGEVGVERWSNGTDSDELSAERTDE